MTEGCHQTTIMSREAFRLFGKHWKPLSRVDPQPILKDFGSHHGKKVVLTPMPDFVAFSRLCRSSTHCRTAGALKQFSKLSPCETVRFFASAITTKLTLNQMKRRKEPEADYASCCGGNPEMFKPFQHACCLSNSHPSHSFHAASGLSRVQST
ncbi:hypothetical protein CEXT_44151 [Caerostris extrusa]|uniref:Uncharacterized protein n=1 Tax=Caerostris extrusa TaxID=172846 RepID=A0AAV4TCA1_CAEEX|nr:hypothetical protein CEXT_44151 [Caerostris extrusa]